jgi:hypothetical protein
MKPLQELGIPGKTMKLSSFDSHNRTTRRGNQNCVINRFMVRGNLLFSLPALLLTMDQAILKK